MDGIDDFDEGPFVIEYAEVILCDYTLKGFKLGNWDWWNSGILREIRSTVKK